VLAVFSGDQTRGMTLADRRGYPAVPDAVSRPAIRVATRIDRERLVAGFMDGLLR